MAESDKRWSPYASVYDPIKVGSIDGTATYPHDRAVVRACQATYHPNPKLDNDPDSTLFVGRLDEEVTEDDLTKVNNKLSFLSLSSLRLVIDFSLNTARFSAGMDPCERLHLSGIL